MAVWKLVTAWVLVGAIVQLGIFLWSRIRSGGHATEVTLKAAGFRWWMTLTAAVTWPISLAFALTPVSILNRVSFFRGQYERVQAVVDADAEERCPRCGESHEDEACE
jgi:hypothetical protein